MPVVKPKPKVEYEKISVLLPVPVANLLRRHCAALGVKLSPHIAALIEADVLLHQKIVKGQPRR